METQRTETSCEQQMIETEIQDRIQGLSYLVYNLAVLTDTQIK